MTTGSAERDFVDWLTRVRRAAAARGDARGDDKRWSVRFRCHNGHVLALAWMSDVEAASADLRCQAGNCGAPLHYSFPNDGEGPPIARDWSGRTICVEHDDCINNHELALACAASNSEGLRWAAGPDGGWLLVDSKGNWRAP